MTEVLIVGAGPVGLMTALGLAREGVAVTLLEAEDDIVYSPRAAASEAVSEREYSLGYEIRRPDADARQGGRRRRKGRCSSRVSSELGSCGGWRPKRGTQSRRIDDGRFHLAATLCGDEHLLRL